MMSELESSQPVTGVSDFTASRPATSASSYIGLDDDDEETRRGGGGGGDSRELGPEEKMHFFSLVRHNKVPEVEDLLNKGFPIETRDAHGNTPLMVCVCRWCVVCICVCVFVCVNEALHFCVFVCACAWAWAWA